MVEPDTQNSRKHVVIYADGACEPNPGPGGYGQPCRKCSTPVIKRKSRKKPKNGYYFEYYILCPACRTTYMVEETKRCVDEGQVLF